MMNFDDETLRWIFLRGLSVLAYVAAVVGGRMLWRRTWTAMMSRLVTPRDVLVLVSLGTLVLAGASLSRLDFVLGFDRLAVLSLALVASLAVFVIGLIAIERARLNVFVTGRTQIIEAISVLVLRGYSTLAALECVAASAVGAQRLILYEIFRSVVFLTRHQTDRPAQTTFDSHRLQSAVASFIARLVWITNMDRDTIQHLQSWKTELIREELMRHRSRQALQPVRLQMIVITVLYIGLFGLGLVGFGWDEVAAVTVWSLPFLVVAMIWLTRLGKRVKWTT